METASLAQPGRQWAFFETVQELAPGTLDIPEHPSMTTGYADIYRGFWTTPQGERIQVAIKEFKTPIPKDRQTKQEELEWKADLHLKREVFTGSQTTHPNLHPLLGYCSRPRPRLISPWRSQGNLKDYLEANPGLTRCDKLRLIFQTACGLEHLHSRTPPICHADIKPENVLINDRHASELSDFGLSRVVQDARSGFTTSDSMKGTWSYMASELFAGQKPSPESDVYAFGGLILTVMSGKAPFQGLLSQVILRRVTLDEPPIPKDHPNLPVHDPLWKLMRCCWSNNPTVRPTMQKVLGELGQIIHEESNSRPRLDLESFPDKSAAEYGDMDLNIPATLQRGISPPSPTANAVPAASSLLGMPLTKVERNAIPGGSLGATRKKLKDVQLNSRAIPVIGKYIGSTAEIGLSLLEITEAMNKSETLTNSLELSLWSLANILQDLVGHRGGNIRLRVPEIQKELEFSQEKLKERYLSNMVRNEFSSLTHVNGECCLGAVRKVLDEIQFLVALDTAGLLDEFENTEVREENRRLINCLGDGEYGAQGNAIGDVVCLAGTRVEILERIDNWIRDKSTPDRVLWIRGMAGRGKSTIASTVAHNWQSRASCAIFHFRRGHNAMNARIVCALARQLGGSLIPDVRNAVLQSVQENEDIAYQRLDVQFETLLAVPLSKLVHQSLPILVIVDALDESQNFQDSLDFVKLIYRHYSSFPTNVKFLLTCRPEAQLLRALEPKKWPVEDLDSSANVAHDLTRFIKISCAQIRNDYGLPEDWPASNDVKNLVEMSQGLFQWAQTVITHIGNGSPVNRLSNFLKQPSTWDGLDNLYHQILSKAFSTVRQDVARQELLCSILGTLVVAPYPISLDVIAALYGENSSFQNVDQQDVIEYLRQDILADLNSLLFIPTSSTDPMHLLHTSIRDLLVHKHRCKERAYYIDVHHHHEKLGSLCLRVMDRCLKENICNLSDLSKPNSEVQDAVERKVSTAIRYCSRAWSIHLTEGTEWSRSVTGGPDGQLPDFESFSKEKLLYWLEVMSLIGATTEAIVIAKRICSWLSRSHNRTIFDYEPLITLWHDAQRFISAFWDPISFGAPHVYASALAHCPQKTQLWEYYGRHAKIRTRLGVQPLAWPANLWTRAIGAAVNTIAFSPDGAVLVSGSSEGTIQLWDAEAGTPLGQPLIVHGSHVYSVAFSPNGRVLASGFGDGTIRLWDAQTGAPLGQPLTGHNDYVRSVAFSPDGSVLASGSEDAIRLWDARNGAPLGQPFTGHKDNARSVVFSPDGKVLASGSGDGTIRLWDARTGTPLGLPLTGHSDCIRSIAFSPDGRLLASGSGDRTIRLWDARSGTLLGRPLTGHTGWVFSVAFSPNSKVLASGSEDDTIRLWDAQTGAPLGQPLTGHDDSVHSVSFSPDGKGLASGSDDRTIRLWDAQIGRPLGQPLTGHNHYICSVVFSPDGMALASGSWDGTIRLWSAQIGAPLGQPLIGHTGWVFSVAFSPDSMVLASGSADGTIRLWDAKTGTPLGQPLTGHTGWVFTVVFSPKSRILASGSDDGTIRLWNAQTGMSLGQPLTVHGYHVYSVAFSPDGRVLASGSGDCTIRLWNAQTGAPLGQPLRGHNDYVRSVAFSPDGSVLASGSEDGTIRLWDAQTGTPLGQPLTGHNHHICSVAFSPDGRVLASGSDDRTIRLWDARSGTLLGQPLTGHTGWVFSVAFSPDSMVLASGSSDGTIRLWDAQIGTPFGQPLTDYTGWVFTVAVSPNGRVLASGSDDGAIRLWDAQTGTPPGQPLVGHNHYICCLAFSPDSGVLASGSTDSTIRLWDVQTGRLLGQPLTGHTGWVFTVAFSPNSRVLASGSSDGTIRLWDAQIGTPFGQSLTGHNDYVCSVAFSPDGRVLASGSGDGTIRLWDAQTGAPLGQSLKGHSDYVGSVAFSPDGRVLASGSWDGTIRLWDAQTGMPFGPPLTGHNEILSFVPILHADPCQPSSLAYHIPNIQEHWVRLSSSRLFWLPCQYWGAQYPTILLSNGTLAIKSNGTLSIFDVSHALQP